MILETKLGAGRHLSIGESFEIRGPLKSKNYYVLPTADLQHATVPGLMNIDGNPLEMTVMLITDEKGLSASNLVVPITAHNDNDSGPETLLRTGFNMVVESAARRETTVLQQRLEDYSRITALILEKENNLFGYPKEILFIPKTPKDLL